MSDVFEKLKAPFPPEKISWRVGSTKKDKSSGLALAYIDARDVMQRLDDVVGPQHWQATYSHADKKTICELSLLLETPRGWEWVAKANGAGDSDIEAEKGAISDAFKRAAVLWGIGRYLYELPNVWVDLEPAGQSVRIKAGQEWKLEKALNGVAHYEEQPEEPKDKPFDWSHIVAQYTAQLADCETLDMLKAQWADITAAGLPAADYAALGVLKDKRKTELSNK